jgi:hypothetical protein
MKKVLLILIAFLICSPVWGATNNWQTGGVDNNWNTAGNWSDGVPTADDNVVLGAGDQAMTINAAAVCRSFDASAYDNTITHNAAITLTIGDGTAGAGNVALAFNSTANMTYTLNNALTSAIAFVSTSATVQTINFNGFNTGNVTFNAASNGSWQLTGTWGTSAVNGGQTTTLTKGTLDTNNQTCHWGKFLSTAGNTRALTLGTSTINLYSTAEAWDQTNSATLTLSAASSTIIFAATTADATMGASKTYGTITFSGAGGNNVLTTASCTIGTLNYVGTDVKTSNLRLLTTTSLTITGTLNIDGFSATSRVLVSSDTLGTVSPLTLTGATISGCTNVDFRDIAFVSTGAVDFSGITGGSGDCGGNTISGGGALTFTTADDWYWYNSGNVNPGNFSNYANWYTATAGGGTQMASTACPLPQDNCYFDSSSVNGTVRIDQDLPRIPGIDFTGVDAMTFDPDNLSHTIFGSLILVSSVTYTTGATTKTFEGRSAYSLSCSSKLLYNITWNMVGGSITLLSNAKISNSNVVSTHNWGTLDFNDYNVDAGGFNSNNSNARKLLLGNGTITIDGQSSNGANTVGSWRMDTVTNLDISAGFAEGSTIVLTTSQNFARKFDGGGLTYNNVTFNTTGTSNPVILGSNTFNVLTITAPETLLLTAGTTQTVTSFVAEGTVSDAIVIDNTTATGSLPAVLSDSSGTNTLKYCTIGTTYNVNAAGGATWNALLTDGNTVTNGTGWTTAGGGVPASTTWRLNGLTIEGMSFR